MTTEFTTGEKQLMRLFEHYLRDLLQHGDAHADATLVELAVLHGFDDMAAAGILADNEFGAEMAAEMCRRACLRRSTALELSQFLCAQSHRELEDLPMSARLQYQRELVAKHGHLLAPTTTGKVSP